MRFPAFVARAILALVITLPAVLSAEAPRAKARRPAHIAVEGPEDCADCHADSRPFAIWQASAHGINLVKCVACHGSTGADFRARPAATTCRSCHAPQAESLTMHRVKDCFACHDPHALTPNPHKRAP